jgi:hypothetical protein
MMLENEKRTRQQLADELEKMTAERDSERENVRAIGQVVTKRAEIADELTKQNTALIKELSIARDRLVTSEDVRWRASRSFWTLAVVMGVAIAAICITLATKISRISNSQRRTESNILAMAERPWITHKDLLDVVTLGVTEGIAGSGEKKPAETPAKTSPVTIDLQSSAKGSDSTCWLQFTVDGKILLSGFQKPKRFTLGGRQIDVRSGCPGRLLYHIAGREIHPKNLADNPGIVEHVLIDANEAKASQ